MSLKLLFILLAGALILAACAPGAAMQTEPVPTSLATGSPDDVVTSPTGTATGQPSPAPYQPVPGDKSLSRGEAFVDSAGIMTLESFPPQYLLTLRGNLPTPCHQLRVEVGQPDAENQIRVEVYSVVDPNAICIQVLEPFEENIPLGSLPAGTYTVSVNGELAGQIEAP
jgi:hypothetical protein